MPREPTPSDHSTPTGDASNALPPGAPWAGLERDHDPASGPARVWPPDPGTGEALGMVELPPAGAHPAPDPELRFTVLHEARRYAIIAKPAGMLSVPGNGAEKAVSVATQARTEFPRAHGPLICHRLDMATSGLMVLALDPDAHRFVSNQFERRRVEKMYAGVVTGHVPETSGVIQVPLRDRWASRPRRVVDFVHGRESITRFRVSARTVASDGQPVTRVWLEPVTGRTHQLRVHLAAPRDVGERLTGREGEHGGLGAALVGDRLYADGVVVEPRLLLHASRLSFADPSTLRPVVFENEPPF